MEELGYMWSYQEGIDEMKHQLLYASLELETVRAEAKEEIRKNEENVTSLLNLLEVAYQERDEARQQLRNVLNEIKLKPLINPTLISPKPNSSITESNSQSLNSSPVGSFFDPVSSPTDPTDMGFLNQPFVQNCNGSAVIESDPFDNLVKGKKLPEKGKLLQAVLDAGPLLSNLLVSGPLPRWRNPPTMQTLNFPPVCINMCDANQNLGGSLGAKRALDSGSCLEMSCGSSRVHPTISSTLNFSADHLSNGRAFTSGINMNNQIHLAKRPRFH